MLLFFMKEEVRNCDREKLCQLKRYKNMQKITKCVKSRFKRTQIKFGYCVLANDSFMEKLNLYSVCNAR